MSLSFRLSTAVFASLLLGSVGSAAGFAANSVASIHIHGMVASAATATAQAAPTLSLVPASTQLPLVQGATATNSIALKSGGAFKGSVILAISGLPSGVSASWNNSVVDMSSSNTTAKVTFTAQPTAPVNWFTYTITATGSGLSIHQSYTLMVQKAPSVQIQLSQSSLWMSSMGTGSLTVTAKPQNGLAVPAGAAGASAQIVSGLPKGVSARWSSPTVNSAGAVSWTLTLNGSVGAVAHTGAVSVAVKTLNAVNNQVYSATQSLALQVALTPPTMSLSLASAQVSAQRNASTTNSVSLSTGGSFQGNVTLTISGLPSGVTSSFGSNPVGPVSGIGASTLKLTVGSSVPVNWYPITVTATGNGMTATKTFTLIVQQTPGMDMQVSQANLWMWSMGSISTTVTATPNGGLTIPMGAVGASVSLLSGLPSGITAAWTKPILNGSGSVSWTLTLTGSVNALASNTPLNVSARLTNPTTGAVYSATKSIALQVALTPPTLSVSAPLTLIPVVQGGKATNVFSFVSGGSFHGNVSLAVTGLPSGVTATWSASPVVLTGGNGASTLTLTAATTAVINWFSFTVTASGDGLNISKGYTVAVAPSVGVQIQLAQATLALQPQSSASLLVTAVPIHGIAVPAGAAGANATVISALPVGVTAAWSQPTVASNGSVNWTLTLNTDATVQAGNNPVGISVQIADKTNGLTYSASQNVSLLVSLLAKISLGATPGRAIPTNFMGLSQEWIVSQNVMGDSSVGVNTAYRQLLSNLSAYGSDTVNLRIGGNSTDLSTAPKSNSVKAFSELSTALGVHFELGLNLAADDVNLATSQASSFLTQMPTSSIDAFEIGNEPDLYARNGIRSANYTVQDYFADFQQWSDHISPLLPATTKLMGTAWASTGMLGSLPAFESSQSSSLGLFGQHYYAVSPSDKPAANFLLSPGAATKAPAAVAAAVVASHTNGIPFRMAETNSIGNGGVHGISDAFSAALWSADIMFEYANVGVDGVNWETGNGDFVTPFSFSSSTVNNQKVFTLNAVNGLYYGMLLFQAATPSGAKLLPVNLSTQANFKAWATVDNSGTPRLLLINKDEATSGKVSIAMPGYSQASIIRLTAPNYNSTSGITLAGQTFDGSTDGTIQGAQTVETISGTNGNFEIPLAITSAALVTFQP